MTRNEFNQWLAYHLGSFRSLAPWFEKMPDRSETQTRWFEVLSSADLADAKAATDEMFADETGRYAALFDQTPPTVRRLARGHQQKRERIARLKAMPVQPDDKQQRYRCKHCLDSTWVVIWNPNVVKKLVAASDGERLPADWAKILFGDPADPEQKHFRWSFAVSCCCKGQEFADKRTRSGRGLMFDEYRHCPANRLQPEKILDWDRDRAPSVEQWSY